LKTDEAHSPASAPQSANDTPKKPREWATAFVGFLAGLVGLALSRLGLIWPDFDVFSHFTVQFMIWTICFAIVPWFFRRMASTAAMAGTVCILTLYGMLPYVNSAEPNLDSSLARPHLRVATFNIYKNNRNLPEIAESVRLLQADVVVLVEFLYEHRELLPLIQAEYPHQFVCYDVNFNCAIAVVSRYPISNSSAPEGQAESRIAYASIQSPIGEVGVAGFHSTRFPFSRKQLKQASELTKLVEKLPRPLILAGDFNATPHSRTVSMIAENAGLKSLNGLPTWPARGFFPQLAIDHIMISNDLEDLTSVATGEPSGSDHLPIVVTVARKEK
jgi:endonuclease/exonuclease/phosphatase (EEP) superfamily protein YafD